MQENVLKINYEIKNDKDPVMNDMNDPVDEQDVLKLIE